MTFDHADYATVVFIDTMVALQCPPLPQLPWSEIDPSGPVLVMVVPQVATEIDKRKRDQRLFRQARAAAGLLRAAAVKGGPITLVEGPPRVDLALARPSAIDWDALDELDREEADARVVAQILHAVDVPPERRLLLSHDVNPLSMASRRGVRCMELPDSWLAPTEPHPKDQEIQRLKGEISKLSATQPALEARLTFQAQAPLRIYRVLPVEGEEAATLVEALAQANPPETQGTAFVNPLYFDSRYDERYDDYVGTALPRFVAGLHAALEIQHAQIGFRLELRNVGAIQAEKLIVGLSASGGALRDRFLMSAIHPPIAPEPRSTIDRLTALPTFHPPIVSFQPPGPHEMRIVGGEEIDATLQAQCEDFRQGRTWAFEGVAWLDADAPSPFSIKLCVTAANLRGTVETEHAIAFEVETVRAADLIDVVARKPRVEIPLQESVDRAIERRDFDWIELPDDDED